MRKDNLGDRMKEYEQAFSFKIPKKHPIIVRVDGKSFHTITRNMDKPFDKVFIDCMQETAKYLLKNVQNCLMVYVQSDEISLLIDDRKTQETDAFFDNKLNKIVSITSSMATMKFNNRLIFSHCIDKQAMFDSRAFILSDIEIPNYFLWRMKDWERNSIQMLARSLYSAKELHKKNRKDLHGLMFKKGVNWAKIQPHLRNGTIFYKDNRDIVSVSRKFDYTKLKNFIKKIREV